MADFKLIKKSPHYNIHVPHPGSRFYMSDQYRVSAQGKFELINPKEINLTGPVMNFSSEGKRYFAASAPDRIDYLYEDQKRRGIWFTYSEHDGTIFRVETSANDPMIEWTINHPPRTPKTINLPSATAGGKPCTVSWSASSDINDNLAGYIVEMEYISSTTGSRGWTQVYKGSNLSTSPIMAKDADFVQFRVCAFDTLGDKSDWITSHNILVANNHAPNAPSTINLPSTIKSDASCAVSWSASSDPDGNLAGYIVELSYAGGSYGSWLQIYKGSATNTSTFISRGTNTVLFRVCAYDTDGAKSDWCTSSNITVLNNHAPNVPSTINLPSTIKGGASCSISWSAASDPDGNLEGYIVERSYNGGSSWSQIYQGSATSTTTTIPHGTSTVMFRVCAYDTDGAKSDWRTSSNKTVLNNRAPTAPSAINVPTKPQGGASISVTWSAASDPDGNLEGYRLERQWDGKGSWSQIYQGSNLSYSDAIPKGAHTSVAYRVRAYDAFGDTSSYTTSPTRTIGNNSAPVIRCDLSGNLGDKTEGFTIPYTVTDPENQTVTVTEKVGGMVKRTYQVTLGQSNTFQITGQYFQKILNGKQTAEIVATDAEGASSTLALTFTKKVHKAVITLSTPFTSDKQIAVCVIKVLGDIPDDANIKVEVTNNANDPTPKWEDATQDEKLGRNHIFSNKSQQKGWAFNFRVSAARTTAGGYITSIQGGYQ